MGGPVHRRIASPRCKPSISPLSSGAHCAESKEDRRSPSAKSHQPLSASLEPQRISWCGPSRSRRVHRRSRGGDPDPCSSRYSPLDLCQSNRSVDCLRGSSRSSPDCPTVEGVAQKKAHQRLENSLPRRPLPLLRAAAVLSRQNSRSPPARFAGGDFITHHHHVHNSLKSHHITNGALSSDVHCAVRRNWLSLLRFQARARSHCPAGCPPPPPAPSASALRSPGFQPAIAMSECQLSQVRVGQKGVTSSPGPELQSPAIAPRSGLDFIGESGAARRRPHNRRDAPM